MLTKTKKKNFTILVLNLVRTVTTLHTTEDASISELSINVYAKETVFTTQIQPGKETAPEGGSNLNVVGNTERNPDQEHLANFLREISTIRPLENKDEKNNYDTPKEVTIKSLSYFSSDRTPERFKGKEAINPLPLVSDNCLELLFRNFTNHLNKYKLEYDRVKDYDSIDTENLINVGISKKRDVTDNYFDIDNKDRNIKIESRKQQKQDTKTTNTVSIATTKILKPTNEINILNNTTKSLNTTLQVTVTEDILKAGGYTEEAWSETKDKTKIRFNKLPERENYLIPTLKLEEGFYPFTFISEFFNLIYPFDFPTELVKDIVWGQFTFPYSFIKSIKVESTFLVFIIIFSCIAFVIPAYLICLALLGVLAKKDERDSESNSLFPEESSECNDRINVAVMLFLLLLCCGCIGCMIVSNEQAMDAVNSGPAVLRSACADISKWIASATRELIHSYVPAVDLVLQAFRDDLKNVEKLLGVPVQESIYTESGFGLVLESLNDIIIDCKDISIKISSLRDVSIRAGSLASMASERLPDLSRQLDNVKRHCSGKDIPLCDTINSNFIELLIKFDSILHEQQLLELRSLGVENLTKAVGEAKQEIFSLPSLIAAQTAKIRDDIIKHIEKRKDDVHSSSQILSQIARQLTTALQTSARRLEIMVTRIQIYEFWRWVAMVCCIAICCLVLTLILFAIMFGCGSAKMYAKLTLQTCTAYMGITSLILWTFISVTFVIAGHAEVYVCHALWDSPEYKTLTSLLDRPSPLLENHDGIFDFLLRDINNVTIEVSIRDVLRECESDQPAYNVFKLDKIVDINKVTSYYEWDDFHKDLGLFSNIIDVGQLKTVSTELNEILIHMLKVSNVNFAKYRVAYNGPLVGRDLPSLVEQMENVAGQVIDLTASGRLESLASRTKRLHMSTIIPLENLRTDMVYKLTELELQMIPFRKKLNISLSHIHTAQYYIDNQGDVIAQQKEALFTERLISHVTSWRNHVLTSTTVNAARCRPLFDVFSATRSLLCTRYVSSLHGWWLNGVILGCLWCVMSPLCATLWRQYGRRPIESSMSLSHIGNGPQGTPTTVCDTSNWNTPGPPPPPNDGW